MDTEEKRTALVEAVGRAIRRYQRGVDAIDEAVADRLGVNRTDLRALDVLEEGPLPAGELAARVGLSAAATTTVLDRLERRGYARRVRDTADRRKVLVEATEQAARLAAEAIGPLVEEGAALLDPFTLAELGKIVRFLDEAAELSDRHAARIRELRAVAAAPDPAAG